MISPRGVLEIPVMGTNSHSSSSSNCSTEKLMTPNRNGNREGNNYALQWKSVIDTIKKKSSVRRFSVIPLLNHYDLSKKNLWKKLAKIQTSEDDSDIEIPFFRPSWKNFEYLELLMLLIISVLVEYQFSDIGLLANESLSKQVNKDSEGFG